jgi:restriction system protein
MARRKKTSPLEDLMDVVALLPWWAGVGLGMLSYVLLHALASQVVPPVTVTGHEGLATQGGETLTRTVWKTLATVGQYVLPVVCFAGAALSALRRRQRRQLASQVVHTSASDVLDGMSWREFEMLVGESFRMQGYRVAETGGGGPDGGVDLVLTRPGRNGTEKHLVQCKQWRAFKVGVDVVRELYGVMAATGATGGFVVTSGRFSSEATAFANGRNVTLIDGDALRGLLRQAQAAVRRPAMRASGAKVTPAEEPAAPTASCPLCSKPMVRRTARRGVNAGGEFWGCTGYPACRGTRQIS